jgi:2-iminobutanoate/2-iminopropanoate deaminase
VDENVLPFSGAVLAGDTLYISGSIGLKDGKVPADPSEEARLVMDSIKRNVEAAGMNMDDLVSVQIYCSDVTHYQKFNDVYKTYFTKQYPARAFIGAGTLLFNARFEVVATAVRR